MGEVWCVWACVRLHRHQSRCDYAVRNVTFATAPRLSDFTFAGLSFACVFIVGFIH